MAESISSPDVNTIEEACTQVGIASRQELNDTQVTPDPTATIIWTPRFMVEFFLLLVVGLSVQSILALVWSSGFLQAPWILGAQLLCLTGFLVALLRVSRSRWLRTGAIFGCIWTIFTALNQLSVFVPLPPFSPVPAYLNAIIASALLGCYICLSLERTPLTAWDNWFFKLTPAIGVCAAVAIFIVTVATRGSFSAIESGLAALGIIFSMLVWWLRPSCWLTQPGPTLLYGLTPALTLLLNLTSLGRGETNFFLTQVTLLAFLLATLRVLQAARLSRPS